MTSLFAEIPLAPADPILGLTEAFQADKNPKKVNLGVGVYQDGTGKVVELARNFCGDAPFVLSYGDILVDPINYQRLVTPVAEVEAIISVKRNEDVSKGGAVFVNEHFEMTDLREKPQPGEPTSPWYNAGVYTFRPSIFEFTAKHNSAAVDMVLAGYEGYLVADAHAVYDHLYADGKVTEVNCWAHATHAARVRWRRRKRRHRWPGPKGVFMVPRRRAGSPNRKRFAVERIHAGCATTAPLTRMHMQTSYTHGCIDRDGHARDGHARAGPAPTAQSHINE